MQNYYEASTSTWVMKLPDDWAEPEDPESGANFESEDASKAVFIATYRLGPEKGETEEARITWLVNNEIANRADMDGYNWAITGPGVTRDDAGSTIVLDSFDAERQYRIVTKLLLSGEHLVRAAFHDYLVEDIHASIACFAPMMQSLKYRGTGMSL